MGEFWAPGAEMWLFKKKNMDRSIDLAVQPICFFIFHAHRTRINIMNQGNSERTPLHVGPTTIFRSHPMLLQNHVNLTSTIQLSSSNYLLKTQGHAIGHFPHKYLPELRGWGLWLPEVLWSRATWCFSIFSRVFFIVEKNVALFLIGIIFSRLVITLCNY